MCGGHHANISIKRHSDNHCDFRQSKERVPVRFDANKANAMNALIHSSSAWKRTKDVLEMEKKRKKRKKVERHSNRDQNENKRSEIHDGMQHQSSETLAFSLWRRWCFNLSVIVPDHWLFGQKCPLEPKRWWSADRQWRTSHENKSALKLSRPRQSEQDDNGVWKFAPNWIFVKIFDSIGLTSWTSDCPASF